jgi:hypothetical protein
VRFSRAENFNEAELSFFSRKYIRGLFKARKLKRNVIEYSGPIGISLRERLKSPITKYDFFFLLELIVDFTRDISSNALSLNKVALDLDKVYINEKTKEIRFIYLPLDKLKETGNIHEFLDCIIYSIVPVPEKDMDYISRLVYFLRSMPEYNPDRLEQYIINEEKEVVDVIKRGTQVEAPKFQTQIPKGQLKNCDVGSTGLLDEEKTSLSIPFNNDTGLLVDNGMIVGQGDSTGLLMSNPPVQTIKYPKLYRVLTDEMIVINKPVFRIGKEKSYTDYYVNNNAAVSRNHADIVVKGNRYYVIDLNSKNRTFINEKVIPVRQETEICNGDHLKLANEEFVFYAN